MWCASVSLSVWANAWLAEKAAPDDVLDALSSWAPLQSVIAYDAVAAGNAGLPWPGRHDFGATSLLQMVRGAAGDPPGAPGGIRPVFPIPGDVRGLPAGTEFEWNALAAGEAVIVTEPNGHTAIGLVPDSTDDDPAAVADTGLSWTAYALPGVAVVEHHDLGDAEYALRSAVRSAADTLSDIGSRCAIADDPRTMIERLVESSRHHRIPSHAPARAVRVLENAGHVDAIVTVSSGLVAAAAQSSSAAQRAAEALQPLSAVVRSARTAAVNAILHSAWRG